MPTLAALITVYHRIVPEELSAALDSLATQTRPAEEIVIVEDGPVGAELRAVIDAFVEKHAEARTVVLARNQGAGPASAAGMATIDAELVGRLDADDIAEPTRFEEQLRVADGHDDPSSSTGPAPDVIGTAMAEFDDDLGGEITGIRALPETHEEIAAYARMNSPINNPSVMYRTARVKKVGGYRDAPYMEDYDLWARLLADGARFVNLPAPLTRFRVTGMLDRRRSKGIVAAEKRMQATLVELGLVSRPRAAFNFAARSAFRLLPTGLLGRAYRALFNRRASRR